MAQAPDQADRLQLLEELEEDERSVSARRRKLHERIDFIRGSGAGDTFAAQQLEHLVEREKELSAHREALHARINDVRLAAGLPRFVREHRRLE